ncbi:hypothetical protein [Streptomyces sp. NPDC016845]|uniref:phage tail fiber protein n=1 Tax=Streptomyces sp. NPDC016845 TaxID=3364972 RepID=UPI00379DF5E7
MAEGFSTAAANSVLDAQVTAYPWFKLHVGAPGPNGTASPATETTRKNPAFAAASGASKATSADAAWTGVAGTEDYTHWSQWSAASGGSFGGSGTVTANAMTTGDSFTIPAGSLVLTVPTAS